MQIINSKRFVVRQSLIGTNTTINVTFKNEYILTKMQRKTLILIIDYF